MNAFVSAVATNQTVGKTFNNAKTLATSGNPCLDFFNAAGNRNVDVSNAFDLAHSKDSKVAFRIALWTRDIRGGAGERQTFRNLLAHFERHYKDELKLMLSKIPELGRWDDLLVFNEKDVKEAAYAVISGALARNDGLCAKWMPRKGHIADELRRYLGYNWPKYRKTLVALSKTVETQMCAKKWNEIIFDHVPSLAAARYQKAFNRNAAEAYKAYRDGLVKVKPDGTTERKINASAVYPYDVIKSLREGDRQVAIAQWNALPNLLGDEGILPLVDNSGSMTSWSYYNQRKPIKTTVTPMDVATSIGLYVANKQKGAFNGMYLSFETVPHMQKLSGDIAQMHAQMLRTPVNYASTNVEAAFKEILKVAKSNGVPQADMPKILLILSDMEFDQAVSNDNVTAHENMKLLYEAAGYNLPKVVFWSINGRETNLPVSHRETGTAVVSGFSPAIFKSILKNDLEDFTPEAVMLATVNVPRYDIEGVTI